MIVGEQQFLAESKGNAGQIICHIEPEIWAEVDETLYIRMMINLLSNALRYGEGRDIEVSLSVHNVSDIESKVKIMASAFQRGIFLIYGNGFIVRINPEQEEVTAGSVCLW